MSRPQPSSPARNEVRQVAPKLIKLSETVLYGDVWERPGLSKRDRSLITVDEMVVDTMNGHRAEAFQWFGRKAGPT